jgi:preprotein translocase subunit SecE
MIKKIKDYLESVRQEMKKVTWPEWDELKSQTYVVIIATIIFTVFIFVADAVFGFLVNLIFKFLA